MLNLRLTEAQNISNISDLAVVQAVNLTIFRDWQQTVMTTATASGTISYLFMIYVLYSQYSFMREIPLKLGSQAILWLYFPSTF